MPIFNFSTAADTIRRVVTSVQQAQKSKKRAILNVGGSTRELAGPVSRSRQTSNTGTSLTDPKELEEGQSVGRGIMKSVKRTARKRY